MDRTLIANRLALGAQRRDVLLLIMKDGWLHKTP